MGRIISIAFVLFAIAIPAWARVPFTIQAPDQNWTHFYNEMCEEASVLMVAEWYAGNDMETIDVNAADEALHGIYEFEIAEYGVWEDTYLWQSADMLIRHFGVDRFDMSVIISEKRSMDDIVAAVESGAVVIFPASGKDLKNPHFTNGGPTYHHLVIYGYDADTDDFIVNDPGTRHGNGYGYSADILKNAWHDWDEVNIQYGNPIGLVIHR